MNTKRNKNFDQIFFRLILHECNTLPSPRVKIFQLDVKHDRAHERRELLWFCVGRTEFSGEVCAGI